MSESLDQEQTRLGQSAYIHDEESWVANMKNPKNWPLYRKWLTTLVISAFSFNVMMTSTMVAPALAQITIDLHIATNAETQLVLSIYVLSYVVGFFIWAPLSDVCGRLPIIQVASTWFLLWNLICSFATNRNLFTIGRFMSGVGGAAALGISPGVISDLWPPEERGKSLAILSIFPVLGPTVGPVIGGSFVQYSTARWRWLFWFTAIFTTVLQLIVATILRETHAPSIQINSYQNKNIHSRDDSKLAFNWFAKTKLALRKLPAAIKHPLILLRDHPILQLLSIYVGISFGILYTVLSTYATLFIEVYRQSPLTASLNYIALGFGCTVGAQLCAPIIDQLYKRNSSSIDSNPEGRNISSPQPSPEIRLYPVVLAMILSTCGLIILGWTAQNHAHWIAPNMGTVLFGIGSQAVTQCKNAYVIDVFAHPELYSRRLGDKHIPETQNHSNQQFRGSVRFNHDPRRRRQEEYSIPETSRGFSVLSTSLRPADTPSRTPQQTPSMFDFSIMRSLSATAMATIWAAKALCGFVFPLFARSMQIRLGHGVSWTILGCINLVAGTGVSFVLIRWGSELRMKGWRGIREECSVE